MSDQLRSGSLTDQIIKSFYKVYQNALFIELQRRGLAVNQEVPIVGDDYADLVVGASVIIELKATEAICNAHERQLVNYLRATSAEDGLLLNFGPKPELRRKIFTNDRKKLGVV